MIIRLLVTVLVILLHCNVFADQRAISLETKINDILASQLQGPKYDDILIITNAPYITAQEHIDRILLLLFSYSNAAKGNLYFLHDAIHAPLFIFAYDSKTDKAIYILLKNGQINESVAKSFLSVCSNADENEIKSLLDGKAPRFLPIVLAWKKGMPSQLRNSILFHDHLCPGLISGYWIANFLLTKFPLKEGERYHIISTPPSCKDDALQAILNATPGKRNLVVIPISPNSKACLRTEAKNLAGIYIKYSQKAKSGEAIILNFLWDDLRKAANAEGTNTFRERLKLIEWMLNNGAHYENFIKVAKRIQLSDISIESLVDINSNILKKFELWTCQ